MIETYPEFRAVTDEDRSRVGSCDMVNQRALSKFKEDPLQVVAKVEEIFGDDLHAMRVLSLANSVVGTIDAAVLSVHAIGRGYAHVAGKDPKHAVKQTDRLLSNKGLTVWALFDPWAKFLVGERKEVFVALDWTEFDADGHATLAGYLITSHGRATPLIWMTVEKKTLEGKRNDHEYRLIERLHECIAPDVKITVLADRGFGDQKLYRFLQTLGWDFIIRFRGGIHVEAGGVSKKATQWVPDNGRATIIRDARVTKTKAEVPAVVLAHSKNMKEPWCLATSLREQRAGDVVKLYARRFTIEETFRDQKDQHFGLGLSATHISSTDRRDRLLLLAAIAQALLTLLGAASEKCGIDRTLKSNTSKKRTMSLLNQGIYLYTAIPNMRDDRLSLLMTTFDGIVREHPIFRQAFGLI